MKHKVLFLICLMMASPRAMIAQKSDISWYVKGFNETIAKNYFDRQINLDLVEGIWQSTDGYKYSIERDVKDGRRVKEDLFRVIVLESSSDNWNMGDIRGFVSKGGLDGIYTMKFYTKTYRTASQSIFLTVESPEVITYYRVDGGGKTSMLKMYPRVPEGMHSGGNSSVGKMWSGSGFAIGDRYIATNNHVVDSAQTLSCYGVGGDLNKKYSLKVVITDKENDLAIAKITDEDFPGFNNIPYTISNSVADVGTQIFVLGYPATDILGSEVKVTSGIINSKTGFHGSLSMYQMDATIQGGSSGGPVFNDAGELIGISVATINRKALPNIANVNYAVKSVNLINLIESCQEPIKTPKRNMLGALSLKDMVKRITPNVVFIVANERSNVNNENNDNQGHNKTTGSNGDKSLATKYYQSATDKYISCDYRGSYDDVKQSVELFATEEAHYLRGHLALFFKDTTIAEESFIFCIDNNYNANKCRYLLADIYNNQGRHEESLQMASILLSQNPKDINALFIKARSKSGLGDKQGAILEYKRAIAQGNPDYNYGTMYNNIAWEYYQRGDYTNANTYIMEALKRDKMKDYIWESDGEIAYHIGEYDRCIRSMSNSICISNNYSSAYLYRGKARLKIRDTINAYYDLMSASDMGDKVADSLLAVISVPIDLPSPSFVNNRYTNPPVVKSNNYNVSLLTIENTSEYTALHVLLPTNAIIDGDVFVIRDPQLHTFSNSNETDTLYIIKFNSLNDSDCPQEKTNNKYPEGYHILYFPYVGGKCKTLSLFIGNIQLIGIKMQDGQKSITKTATEEAIIKRRITGGHYKIISGDVYRNGKKLSFSELENEIGTDLFKKTRKANLERHLGLPFTIAGGMATAIGLLVAIENPNVAPPIIACGIISALTGITLSVSGKVSLRRIENELNQVASITSINISPAIFLAKSDDNIGTMGLGVNVSIGL